VSVYTGPERRHEAQGFGMAHIRREGGWNFEIDRNGVERRKDHPNHEPQRRHKACGQFWSGHTWKGDHCDCPPAAIDPISLRARANTPWEKGNDACRQPSD
jgi:hypothetical protein